MTLKELLESVQWADVERELRRMEDREDQLRGYRTVFDHLHELHAVPDAMRILLRIVDSPEPGEESSIEAFGRDGRRNRESSDFKYIADTVDDEWADAETDFGLELTPWEEWLGMKIDPATLAEYPAPRIVADCIWDMTFHGFDQEKIREFEEDLEREAAKIDAMTPEEREEYMIPAEEVFRRLREEFGEE